MEIKYPVSMLALSLALTACGGGGGGGGSTSGGVSPPPTAYFRDANVVGLAYSSGARSGITGTNGTLQYEEGKPITFKVGAVDLGTVSVGKGLILPIDLTDASSNTDAKVLNRVRFLMTLDQDGNPANGISISANTREAAKLWSPINFDGIGFTIPAGVQQDIAIADGRTVTVPDSTEASAHLSKTLACAYSGVFTGTASGLMLDESGTDYSLTAPMGVVVGPTGSVIGLIRNPKNQATEFDISGTIDTSTKIPNISGSVQRSTDSKSFHAGLIGADSFEAIFGMTKADGFMKASRIGNDAAAKYRFVGYYSGTDAGVFAFDIASDNKTVSGITYSIRSGKASSFSGQDHAGYIETKTSDGTTVKISINGDLSVDGMWVGGPSDAGSIIGTGCQLN